MPCQIFPCRALMIPCRALMIRAQKYGFLFCRKKKAPAATYPQVQGFQKYGSFFCGKKGACGNVPTSQGLPEIWPPWDSGRKTRFSNGLAYNRSKVSVRKSQTGFAVINFSRSIFPYMSNIYENGKMMRFVFYEKSLGLFDQNIFSQKTCL